MGLIAGLKEFNIRYNQCRPGWRLSDEGAVTLNDGSILQFNDMSCWMKEHLCKSGMQDEIGQK